MPEGDIANAVVFIGEGFSAASSRRDNGQVLLFAPKNKRAAGVHCVLARTVKVWNLICLSRVYRKGGE